LNPAGRNRGEGGGKTGKSNFLGLLDRAKGKQVFFKKVAKSPGVRLVRGEGTTKEIIRKKGFPASEDVTSTTTKKKGGEREVRASSAPFVLCSSGAGRGRTTGKWNYLRGYCKNKFRRKTNPGREEENSLSKGWEQGPRHVLGNKLDKGRRGEGGEAGTPGKREKERKNKFLSHPTKSAKKRGKGRRFNLSGEVSDRAGR